MEQITQHINRPIGAAEPSPTVLMEPAGNVGAGDLVDGHVGKERKQRAFEIAFKGLVRGPLPLRGAAFHVDPGHLQ